MWAVLRRDVWRVLGGSRDGAGRGGEKGAQVFVMKDREPRAQEAALSGAESADNSRSVHEEAPLRPQGRGCLCPCLRIGRGLCGHTRMGLPGDPTQGA